MPRLVIVPLGCRLRVGNETRQWEEGELLIFDDSIEHEARNPTDRLRVILPFGVWRPEIDGAERKGVASIFEAIDPCGRAESAA
jgi:aspartyl/asparaginyl beta-hydroxylase (cupin superfamily)